MPEFS